MNYISNIYRTISNMYIYLYTYICIDLMQQCHMVSVIRSSVSTAKKLSKLVIRPPLWLPECLLHLFRCPMCQLDLDHTNVIHISPIASRRLGKSTLSVAMISLYSSSFKTLQYRTETTSPAKCSPKRVWFSFRASPNTSQSAEDKLL